MRGKRKITKTMKKRWAHYALPAGFAKRGYLKVSSCRTIKKSMMGHKNPLYGCQITCKQYRSWLNTLPNDSIGSWGELENQFARNFCSTYKRPASLEEIKSCVQKKGKTLRSYIQRWSVIKNSAEDISDEREIDAFSAGLRHSDLVEEIGRTRPRTVSELMEVANRFADGEDAYNNKRRRSPEVDKTSRQRRRYRNGDNYGRRN
jgi:hypothetical protein